MKLLPILFCSLPGLMAQAPAPSGDSAGWSAHAQATCIWQDKLPFAAPYTGENSLRPEREQGRTFTATAFLGARLWPGAEAYVDPELSRSAEISGLKGLGGLTNGEDQKGGAGKAKFYCARAFLRQTWDLGGEPAAVPDGPNQVAGTQASRRLVLAAGKLAVMDLFDASAVAHDPRTAFVNWTFLNHGAYDFAADTRGYTWGAALEADLDAWAIRAGRFAQPKASNGPDLDSRILDHHGDQVEVERAIDPGGQPGRVRLLAFRNVAVMGAFREALAKAQGGIPEVAAVRRRQAKTGGGVSLEQACGKQVACIFRASWNDGRTETYAFAEIERSVSAGVRVQGGPWRRPGDSLGFALGRNGLSSAHRAYLAAGGLGAFIGDGRLAYAPEQVAEVCYVIQGTRGLWLSAHAQAVRNPADNADRGPVRVFGCRLHLEL